MMLPFRPKPGSIVGKPGYVQEMKKAGPPEFEMADYVKDGITMAAQRLIDGIKSGSPDAVVSAMRNLYTLMELEHDTSESE